MENTIILFKSKSFEIRACDSFEKNYIKNGNYHEEIIKEINIINKYNNKIIKRNYIKGKSHRKLNDVDSLSFSYSNVDDLISKINVLIYCENYLSALKDKIKEIKEIKFRLFSELTFMAKGHSVELEDILEQISYAIEIVDKEKSYNLKKHYPFFKENFISYMNDEKLDKKINYNIEKFLNLYNLNKIISTYEAFDLFLHRFNAKNEKIPSNDEIKKILTLIKFSKSYILDSQIFDEDLEDYVFPFEK